MHKKNGCVYFFRHIGLEPIKIGYSTNNTPFKRFEQFKTYAPFGGEIVAFAKSSIAFDNEKTIHEKYSGKRLCGEWFNITIDEVLSEIEQINKLETLFK